MEGSSAPRVHLGYQTKLLVEAEWYGFGCWDRHFFVQLRGELSVSFLGDATLPPVELTSFVSLVVPSGNRSLWPPIEVPALFEAKYTFGYCGASPKSGCVSATDVSLVRNGKQSIRATCPQACQRITGTMRELLFPPTEPRLDIRLVVHVAIGPALALVPPHRLLRRLGSLNLFGGCERELRAGSVVSCVR